MYIFFLGMLYFYMIMNITCVNVIYIISIYEVFHTLSTVNNVKKSSVVKVTNHVLHAKCVKHTIIHSDVVIIIA